MPGKFVLKTAKDGQRYFNLKARNGEVLLTSEMYKAKASALNGIASVQANAPNEARYSKQTSKTGKFYFTLKAGNNQVIGNSEMYETEKARNAGIQSVMKSAPGAPTEEVPPGA
ncbi:MAG: DUF1508 domain-containing protein [Acidobacteria bacterium]|nr:DUF1508 domain-containing protein [Acidobacteriota bacterium]